MSIKTTINNETNIIVRTVSGPLSASDIKQAFNASLQEEDFQKNMHVIWDLTDAEISNIKSEDMFDVIDHILKLMDERGSDYKIAIVAPSDLAFGVSRIFKAYGSGLPVSINVLKNMQQACNWIHDTQ